MIVADTDVLIGFLANRGPAAHVVADAFERGRLATTAVSRLELLGRVADLRLVPLEVR